MGEIHVQKFTPVLFSDGAGNINTYNVLGGWTTHEIGDALVHRGLIFPTQMLESKRINIIAGAVAPPLADLEVWLEVGYDSGLGFTSTPLSVPMVLSGAVAGHNTGMAWNTPSSFARVCAQSPAFVPIGANVWHIIVHFEGKG